VTVLKPGTELFDGALSSLEPDAAAVGVLEEAASRFRRAGRTFEAAYITERAAQRAIGSPRRILDLVQTALADYAVCWDPPDICGPEALAALTRSIDLHRHWIWPRDDQRFRVRARALLQDLASRLVRCSIDGPDRAGYLVHGLVIEESFTGDWALRFSRDGVDATLASNVALVRIEVPAAFQCYLRLADYVGAQRVVELCPEAFTSASLLGWRAVVRGHVWPEAAVEAFEEAAHHFHSDSMRAGAPDRDCWAYYFQARSLLAAASRDPIRAADLLLQASEALPYSPGGTLPPEVSRLATLLLALSSVAARGTPSAARAVRHQYLVEARGGDDGGEDPTHKALVRLVADALEPLAADPVREMSGGRVLHAMQALRRLPHLPESDTSPPIKPAINLKAPDMHMGPICTGLHRAIAGVFDQVALERLLLRILQAWAPMHAQVVHGPVQRGRDVAVLFRIDGEHVLRQYRVRAGDAGIVGWPQVRSELEELFRVPIDDLQAPPGARVRKVGTLVLNGRVAGDVRSEVAAWAGHQRRAYRPEAEVIDLDDWVDWIVGARLVNDLKAALRELGCAETLE
jgi:hypothetical protein